MVGYMKAMVVGGDSIELFSDEWQASCKSQAGTDASTAAGIM